MVTLAFGGVRHRTAYSQNLRDYEGNNQTSGIRGTLYAMPQNCRASCAEKFRVGGTKMKWEFGEYTIDTDKSLVPASCVKEFLSKSYWAADRTVEQIKKSIENSFCYGVYHQDELVGFARVVTDYATVFWICDVYIHEQHRKKGLGKKLVNCIMETDEFKYIRGILATQDAHSLYEKFGFQRVESRFMAWTL